MISRAAWPPVVRALVAQGAALAVVLLLAFFMPPGRPLWLLPAIQGLVAAGLAQRSGLGFGWICFEIALPFALLWQLGHHVNPWIYPALLAGFALVFGGGLASRVPLYNSSRIAWRELLGLLPEQGGFAMVDLGAGLGGPLRHIAQQRPEGRFHGVEASPLVWLVAWLRTRPVRRNCSVHLGSLWNVDLGDFQFVYAFLSPVPMSALWSKARREMKPGSLLISNTFQIPEAVPERIIALPGRKDARLWVYRI